MIMPPMGNRNTTRHQATLCRGGRLDLRTSTVGARMSAGCKARGDRKGGRTEDDDIEDQDDETEKAADAGDVVVEGAAGGIDGVRGDEGGQAELEDEVGEGVHDEVREAG